MRSLAVIFTTLLALSCGSHSSDTWTPPALAAIVAGGKSLCSATIVDDYYVVTSAQCVQNLDVNSTDVYVRVGSKTGSAQSIKAISITVDSQSKRQSQQQSLDLAVVEVESRFSYTGDVMWASPSFLSTSANYEGVVATWSKPKTLKGSTVSAPVKAITSTVCETYLKSVTINSTQICLLPTVSTSKPCK